jgi:hypothetical protein
MLAATGYADDQIGDVQPGDSQRVADLLDRAGTYLQVHARPSEARPLFERALRIDEASYGPDHPIVAMRLNNLALLLRDLGDPASARRCWSGRWYR